MKDELVNFVKDLPAEVFSYNLNLTEGLYVLVDLDAEGNLIDYEFDEYDKKKEMTPFFAKCLNIQTNVKPVSSAKIFDASKKIFNSTCTAFSIGFNKKNLYKEENGVLHIREEELKSSLDLYFKSAKKYIDESSRWDLCFFTSFYNFLKKGFDQFLQIENIEALPKPVQLFLAEKKGLSVNIYFRSLILDESSKVWLTNAISHTAYQKYVNDKVFNKEKDNLDYNGVTYGISDSLCTFNESKTFLKHKTAPFEFNYRLNREEAKYIWEFFNLVSRKVLINPLPIFIDKKELNREVVRVLHGDSTKKLPEILETLFVQKQEDLGSYYLLFIYKNEIIDLDFVPSFQYKIEGMQIEELFSLGGKIAKTIHSIFEFEKHIANIIFNKQLCPEKGWAKYFGDIDYNPKYMTDNTYNQLLSYRKAFYDYIYKSKRQAIQSFMFHDLMVKGILDDLQTHGNASKDRKNNIEFSIKEKLNIWFSLYTYFDSPSKQVDMVNKTRLIFEKVKQIGESDAHWLENDEEFAFAVGQLVRYLLIKSESADRSHALLEPFLQKTEARLLKLAIAKTFDTYKHAITLYNGRYSFDRLMSQVMGYEPTTANMKDLLPFILAGYFAENVLFIKTKND